MQQCCCPDDEKEENDVEGQNQNHEEHILSQYIRPDIYMNRMPEKPSELTKQEEVLYYLVHFILVTVGFFLFLSSKMTKIIFNSCLLF